MNPRIEEIIAAFEAAWRIGTSPELREFLDDASRSTWLSESDQELLVRELVAIDIEFRGRLCAVKSTRAGSQPWRSLAEYRAEFTILGEESLALLAAEEYRARRLGGEELSTGDYLNSIPNAERARSNVIRVAAEILADAKSTPKSRRRLESPTSDPHAPLPYSDFLLKKLIGSGGMGKVYLGLQRSLDRYVAVKFLRRSLADYPEAIARFTTEAKTVAQLNHPGIVGIHGLGRTPGGGYFIVMDLIDGQDLGRHLSTGPIEVQEALRIVIDVARALAHAHSRGVIHCDLKPSNVLLDCDGAVFVTDFGLARRASDDDPFPIAPAGTAAFMAPEQIDASVGCISFATDVYGLGGLLFATLTGNAPRTGDRVADVLAMTMAQSPLPDIFDLRSDVPKGLCRAASTCLEWHPERRYATVEEFLSVVGPLAK